jgi:3-hydroxyisobutyrate dehydrogenase
VNERATTGTLGFVGLGNMGAPIARRLLGAGHNLVVHDLRREAGERLVAAGARWAADPADVARICDLVFASVPGGDALTSVALGDRGVVHGARPGALFVSLSTVAPAVVRDVAERLASEAIDTLDAPVSGSVDGARDGSLLIAVGGGADAVERARPYLEGFSSTILHVGAVGAGTTAKIAHNLVTSITRVAIAEGMTLAMKGGVAPDTMLEVLRTGSFGRQRVLASYIPKVVFTGAFDVARGSLDEAIDVTELANDLAEELDVPIALGALTLHELMTAAERGWGQWSAGSTFLLQEERAGVQLRVDPESS